ncbi:MAG TPA: FISUMP domain-containing protein, partial [Bacteroidales bacterium]|nr:FISUMP domain-containing protein [Bacteroidales bacterium]
NPSANNATGFSALPAGHYCGYYIEFGVFASYWSATEFINEDRAYYYYIATYSTNNDIRKKDEKSHGSSVRCLRD